MGRADEAIIKAYTEKFQWHHGLSRDDAFEKALRHYFSKYNKISLEPDTSSDEDETKQYTQMQLLQPDGQRQRELEEKKRDGKAMYIAVHKFSGTPTK
jgi:hypothetical protein